MEAIHRLSLKYKFRIIEDASHAIGGRYKDSQIGSCRFSDVTVFSFHPVKIITTGEGGMALTNDVNLSKRMARLRSHGVTREAAEMNQAPDGPWYYQQLELGFNYRMTEIQAALGLSQMARLDAFVKERHLIASEYDSLLSDLSITIPYQRQENYSAYHLYVIRLSREQRGLSHRQVFEKMRLEGIGVNLHYIPIYRQPYYARMNYNIVEFPNAEAYYKEAISLPIFPGLDSGQIKDVVRALTTPSGYQTLF